MKRIISLLIAIVTVTSMLTFAINCNAKTILGDYKYLDNVVYLKVTETDNETNQSTTYYCVDSFFENESIEQTKKEITIPSSIDGIPVKKIWSLFSNSYILSVVEKINLPETITHIGKNAFCFMSKLKYVNIPDSVEEIDEYAFSGCRSLETIVFPKKVTLINSNICSDCSNLKSVIFKGNINKIDNYAFLNCKNLKSLNLPTSLKEIGSNVIGGTAIKSITVPKKALCQKNAFEAADKLKKVTFKNVKGGFSGNLFSNCKSLKEINLKSIKNFSNFKIDKGAFSGTKPGIKFYVRNKKLAKKLYNGLKSRKVKKAKIYVGKKLVYKTK